MEDITPSALARFWTKVDKSGDCWLWTGAKDRNGYGYATVGPQRSRRAHRVAWRITHGEWPAAGLFVCHKCDNPPCVRPDHLYVGTVHDNARDRTEHGRQRRGEQINTSRLTADDVRAIRARYAAGETSRHLAAVFGVNHHAVQMIARRESWKHVT